MRSRTNNDAGFTLLELIVVLVIMGLVLGMVITNGPMRSERLAQVAAARGIAEALQDAGARAIAQDRSTRFFLDPVSGVWREGKRGGTIPPGTRILFHGITGAKTGAIIFAPDGSASGGRITLDGAGDRRRITVDWLTGRIGIDVAHPGR